MMIQLLLLPYLCVTVFCLPHCLSPGFWSFGQYDKGPEMAEAAGRRVIISGFEVTSPFVILSGK